MTNSEAETRITIGIIALLLICLFKLPYGAYSLIRYLLLFGFGYLAYRADEDKLETLKITFIALAVLFQPIFKIPLGRMIWNILDLAIAVFLIYMLLTKKNGKLKTWDQA